MQYSTSTHAVNPTPQRTLGSHPLEQIHSTHKRPVTLLVLIHYRRGGVGPSIHLHRLHNKSHQNINIKRSIKQWMYIHESKILNYKNRSQYSFNIKYWTNFVDSNKKYTSSEYMIISSGKYFAYEGFLAKKVRLYRSQIMLNPPLYCTVKWVAINLEKRCQASYGNPVKYLHLHYV